MFERNQKVEKDSINSLKEREVCHYVDFISDHHYWNSAFNLLSTPTLIITEGFHIVSANKKFSQMVSGKIEDYSGMSLTSFIEVEELSSLVQQAVESNYAQGRMQWLLHRSTRPSAVSIEMRTISHPNHCDVIYLLVSMEDLREQDRIGHDLHIAQEAARIGSWYTDFDGKFWFTSTGAKIFGVPDHMPVSFEDLIGRVHPDDRSQAEQRWNQGLKDGSYKCEIRVGSRDQIRWVVKNVSFDLDHSGQPIRGYGVVQDITEQKLTEAKIRHLADIDELTGLPNRRRGIELAEDTVEKSAHQKKSVALIYIDLDKFKEINDIHGHAIGDSVLAVIGQRFLEKTSVDSVFSRLGGDEFMLAHSFSCYEALNEEISGLLEAVSKPLQIGDIALQLEASIGAAVFPEQGHCVETLMQYADIAMYQAKKMGSAFQFYSTELGEYHTRQIILASKLKRAIDESTLQVYFQPKVCFSKGKLCGIEALARWHDPEYGWISPTEFIKVAENNGLISRLDDWSLATVCSYWRTWRDEGLALPASISVNVSARQLSDNTFLDRALVLIKQYKISPEDIDFEITETALFDDLSKVQEIVIKLVSSGFSLSIDDFGTGYSSLSRLHKLSISQLKIDMSFIQDMLTNQSSLSIVTAVINMAKVLNLNTIAEGVETKEQHEMLAKLGCDQGQGYYYSRPLSVDVFMSNWLKT